MNRRQIIALLSVAASGLVMAMSGRGMTYANLEPRDPARRLGHSIAYGADPRQKLDVYAPTPADAHPPMAVVVFFYGGSWNSGTRRDYVWAARALAAQGFLVVVPDYRIVPQVYFPAFTQDGAAAVRWAQDNAARYGGDPSRILLIGHSAGAGIALHLALDDEFLTAAGVSPAHIKGAVGLSGPYDYYPFTDPDAKVAFGRYPDPHATQPITYAGRPGRPPVLLIHGALDDDVPVRNSVALDAALRAAGNPSTLRVYPGLTHPDTVLALSMLFRDKAPILEETARFMKASAGVFP